MGTFNIQLPGGMKITGIPVGTSPDEVKAMALKNGVAPQQFVPTERLEKAAAASAPPVEGFWGTLSEAAKEGVNSLLGGVGIPTLDPLTLEPSPQVAAPMALIAGPNRGEAALNAIPGARGAVSLADVGKRYVFGGAPAENLGIARFGAPLTHETLGEAQKNIAGTAGQLGAMGAVGEAGRVPGVGKSIAPQLEEAGLGVNDITRGKLGGLAEEKPQGAIGSSMLQETEGYGPREQALSGQKRLNDLTGRMEENVHSATKGGVKLSNESAQQALDSAVQKVPRNAPDIRAKIESLRDRLELPDHEPGTPYTPDELLEIKRGIGKSIKHWGPDWMRDPDLARAEKSIYAALDNELDQGVPGNKEINDRIHRLIPGVSQAVRRGYGAGAVQSMADRIALRTGGSQVALWELMTGNPIKSAAAAAIQEAAGRPFMRTAAARLLYKFGGGENVPVPPLASAPPEPVRLALPPGPMFTPPPPDESFVRGVPAMAEAPEAVRFGRLLPQGEGIGPITVPYRGEPAGSEPTPTGGRRGYPTQPQPAEEESRTYSGRRRRK